ncbi:PilZ domain-containing protein [Bacteriovorax sp. Seq25_V]|uniref:PilZ domain-containing protein n=1 Tax=Bacteriovorax sp. Seq25_V TaxID=1201288 RepID=UPI00038A1E43|nr:PilZ domain-containing protein [Bacteriovorax sp. Seq25_V]EQC43480.1 type IV pilus assembly protein PilZ [Bacteriovorax sp. Seq25_V]
MLKLKGEEKTFEQLIAAAVSTNAKAFIWDLEANEIIRVPVELKNYNAFKKVVNFEIDHRAKEYIKDLISGPGVLKFYIPDSQLLFVSKVEMYRGSHLEVRYPEAFQKHDRRREDRLEPLIPVHFKMEGIKKECYDVSFGGFSFILNGLEFRNMRYEPGQIVECHIEFPTKKIKIKAEIVNIANLKPFQVERFPYGAKRISFKVESNDFYKESVVKLGKGMKKLLTDLL